MSKRFFAAICITLFLILSSSINAGPNSTTSRIFSLTGNDFSSSEPLNYVPGELLVKYKPQLSLSSINSLHSQLNVTEIKRFSEINVHHIKLPSGTNVEDALKEFKNNPSVEYAEPNYIRQISLTPNDTYFTNLWGMHNTGQAVCLDPPVSSNCPAGTAGADIKATEAWDIATSNSAIIVGLIDSGVAYNHPDLAANISATRYDFVNSDSYPMDSNDHGTHVAGTIAAVGNNNLGVAGVTWSTKIIPIRAADAFGVLTVSNIISAIDYARTNGAKIINASFGGGNYSSSESAAIAAARDAGILFVAAAGNGDIHGNGINNDTTPDYPASYNLDNIISVAATDQNDHLSSFSNYGLTSVHVAAPGENIYSTRPARQTVFSENFDGTGGTTWPTGWTHGGVANDTWGFSSSQHNSGSYSLAVNPVGNYSNSANAWVRSPAIDLSSSLGTILTFNVTGKSQPSDKLHVEVSTDNITWYDFGYLSGDLSTKWYSILVDLGGYDNGSTTFYVRFRFVSDASTNDIGFFIDDVTITAASTSYTGTDTDYYQFMDGTSMATPHVTGLAALIWGYLPSLTYSQVKDIIMRSVDLKSSLTGKTVTGGRINAYKALNYCITPAAPASLTATGTTSRIDLSWTDNLYETGYKLERKKGTGGTYAQIATISANTTTFSDTTVEVNAAYYYRLAAYNYGGASSYSNEASATATAPAADGGGGGGCFIATAAFGSPLEKHVQILRDFRDRVLLNSSIGKAFVVFYYRISPPIADKIAASDGLRLITRIMLMPVIGVAWLIVHFGMFMTMLLFTIMVLTVIFTIVLLRKFSRVEQA